MPRNYGKNNRYGRKLFTVYLDPDTKGMLDREVVEVGAASISELLRRMLRERYRGKMVEAKVQEEGVENGLV